VSVITDIISSPIKGVLDGVSDLIKTFVKDPNQQVQAQLQLATLQNNAQLALVQADQAFAESEAKVIAAEAASPSWLTSTWRPILMLVFTTIVAYNYLVCPLLSRPVLPLPPDLWELLKLGVGGYVMGRSLEKVADSDAATAIVQSFTNVKVNGKPVSPTP
jgi:Holin of 3TMs, for gene-transfer release